ncbi:MAG: glutathione S-transferase family protein [Cyanobacteria bacterium P01_H01_bin.58]
MTNRALLFTSGSPFARAVRVVLDELGLDYERREEITTPSVAERAAVVPTLQVPTLWDAEIHLWDSALIIEYLMTKYIERTDEPVPLARFFVRDGLEWHDRLLVSTIQTLGTAATTISQMKWGGTSIADASYLQRSADRLPYLLNWLEGQLGKDEEGFFPRELSAQDILLACHLDFIQNRPIDLKCNFTKTPRVEGLLARLRLRPSFKRAPIYWWEPGIVGYEDDGTPIYS